MDVGHIWTKVQMVAVIMVMVGRAEIYFCTNWKFSDSLWRLSNKDKCPVNSTACFDSGNIGNYEPFPPPPQGGAPVHVEGADSNMDLYMYGMSITTSDQIPLDRDVKDVRHPACRHWNYPRGLPTASVIIAFHNEGWSTLLRTIISIINRSPPEVLVEVLLVDDFSSLQDFPHLGEQLQNWVDETEKVRLIRNPRREGLIRTKTRGAEEAIGEVVVFLDAHCEVNLNWLPPLLTPIMNDPKTLTVPLVDGINFLNFEYTVIYGKNYKPTGIWEWGLLYKELQDLMSKDPETDTKPYPSPLHAGGLIAVNREYFLSLGGYDDGLLVWGGEQYELSFKIWMCGGRILWVPCSRVGHVYRKLNPNTVNTGTLSFDELVMSNLRRVVETWFDEEHKEYFYTRNPSARSLDFGDISRQVAFRNTCRSFSWFMENVASGVYRDFPKPPPNVAWGRVTLSKDNSICWRARCREPPCLIEASNNCHSKEVFKLNAEGQLSLGERCLEPQYQEPDTNQDVVLKLYPCTLGEVHDNWRYNKKTGALEYDVPVTDQGAGEVVTVCVQSQGVGQPLTFRKCAEKKISKWRFTPIY